MTITALSFHNLINSDQITENDIETLIKLAEQYRKSDPEKILKDGDCYGAILATLFFEPSTRTRFSFEAAMMRLGGQIVTLEQGISSSVKKGESLADMGRIMSGYVDIVAMRHPATNSVVEFASNSKVPVINAGDGDNQHPTQSLIDIYTIYCEKGRLDNLRIGILGDLKYGRSVKSLAILLSRYKENNFKLISHPSLTMNDDGKEIIKNNGCDVFESCDLESAIKDLDVLYDPRVQKERFKDEKEYLKVKDEYQIKKEILENTNPDMIIMHALPRVNEIDPEIDNMPCAKYFEQAEYGLYMRMALLALMSKKS